jgi:hypothetical protein
VCGVCAKCPQIHICNASAGICQEGGDGGGRLVQYARIQPFAVTFCTDKYAGRHVFRFANMYSMYTISGRVEKGRSVGNMYGSLEVVRNQF